MTCKLNSLPLFPRFSADSFPTVALQWALQVHSDYLEARLRQQYIPRYFLPGSRLRCLDM